MVYGNWPATRYTRYYYPKLKLKHRTLPLHHDIPFQTILHSTDLTNYIPIMMSRCGLFTFSEISDRVFFTGDCQLGLILVHGYPSRVPSHGTRKKV